MAERHPLASRPVLLAAGGGAALALVVWARGPLALLAASLVAVVAGVALTLPPLLAHDGIDWDWLPDRAAEVPPEPGIATLRRLLAPDPTDNAAPEQFQRLVRAVAEDRADAGALGRGPLAAYLAGPPRVLTLAEAAAVITELEALPTKGTP